MKKQYNKQEITETTKKKLRFLGALLREYRWEDDFTRLEAQQQSGIHYRTIARIENGENISLVTLFRYMEFLNLDLTEIAFADEDI